MAEGTTPLDRKLGIKPGHQVTLRHAPSGFTFPDVEMVEDDIAGADVVLAFYRSQADLDDDVAAFESDLAASSSLWICWPRRAGGHRSDITDNVLRELLLPTGLVDVKVAMLSNDWSALKFVWRKELRALRT
ncbi:DUF3052 family protein [Kutzneria chonburiensis]|uniref:DUF3052 family protein n=1 Tax=Kutzneria chonburiensis TaxID=1483604 RepID=A0ABV6N8Z8_9PSEU|nr:DUF3052 family protein [Kutzneria chonburiensis]